MDPEKKAPSEETVNVRLEASADHAYETGVSVGYRIAVRDFAYFALSFYIAIWLLERLVNRD